MKRTMKRTMQLLVLIMALLLAAACSPVTQLPAASDAAQPAPTTEDAEANASTDDAADTADTADTAGAADAAAGLSDSVVAALAGELGVEAADLTVVSAEPVEWNDACLGVTAADEMCAQVITPGYRVVVEAGGEQYTYHTDAGGSSLRLAPAEQAATDSGAANLPDSVLTALADELGVPAADLTVVSAEAVEWNDACLGVTAADEMCAQVITPGYRVVVEVGGEQYTYHTDASGSSLRLAPAEQAAVDKPVTALDADLAYFGPQELGSADVSRCAQMTIANSEAASEAAGEARLVDCEGAETTLPLPEGLASTLGDLRGQLGSFAYETPSEQVIFQGSGANTGEEWQRAVLAWARATRAELAGGQTSATARTALSWNLGLLADMPDVCAHLIVLDYGYAYAEQRNCESGDLVSSVEGWLEQGEMEQFDGWLYGYAPLYAGESSENYVNGVGAENMTDDQAAAVADWAQALWERLVGLPLTPADDSQG